MQRGFTKLFNTIVTSTIWQEDDKTRIVWITMLAIADAAGIVGASIPGLASVSNVSVNAARAAVKTLLAPDADSRTKDFDGRRIEEIDGGWRILNHAKYRRMLNEEERKEYKAKWIAEKRRQESTVDKSRQSSTPRRRAAIMSTQAEAEADNKNGGANGSRPTVEDWIVKLEQNPTYKGINVRQLHGRMVTWCEVRGLKPTLRRLVTWLNKEDKPMPKHSARADYKRNYAPPAREPTEVELENARRIAHEETARFKEQFK
jgi:hypothetical protein